MNNAGYIYSHYTGPYSVPLQSIQEGKDIHT